MNILDILKWYFVIGVIVTLIEWILLGISKSGVLFECDEPIGGRIIIAFFVFVVEVILWPRQLGCALFIIIRMFSGKCNDDDVQEMLNAGYTKEAIDYLTRNRKDIRNELLFMSHSSFLPFAGC